MNYKLYDGNEGLSIVDIHFYYICFIQPKK